MPTNWNTRSKPTTSYNRKRADSFLLTETFNFLLLETGGKIKLDQFGKPITSWNRRTPI